MDDTQDIFQLNTRHHNIYYLSICLLASFWSVISGIWFTITLIVIVNNYSSWYLGRITYISFILYLSYEILYLSYIFHTIYLLSCFIWYRVLPNTMPVFEFIWITLYTLLSIGLFVISFYLYENEFLKIKYATLYHLTQAYGWFHISIIMVITPFIIGWLIFVIVKKLLNVR